jgi:hypothetical protein
MAGNEIVLNEKGSTSSNDVLMNGAASGLSPRVGYGALAAVPEEAQILLSRMFADPSVLDKTQRAGLVRDLRLCVQTNPDVSELRVLFGMALCVNLEVSDAIEELREGVRLAPHSFIAQLKMGELWMRLRVMDKAEEHTRRAALLAANRVQAELARRQGASIRAMKHAGIERGGYKSPWTLVTRVVRRLRRRESSEAIALAEIS